MAGPDVPRGAAVRPYQRSGRRVTLLAMTVAEWVPLAIASERCKACELCILACPHGSLALDTSVVNRLGYHPVSLVKPETCTSCAFCARVCPDAVFTIYAPRKPERTAAPAPVPAAEEAVPA